MKTLLRAEYVATMAGPVLRDGAVVFEGDLILAVGAAVPLRRAFPDVIVEDLGDSVLLPGLVNAHTHLELSDHVREPLEGGFIEWISRRRAPRTETSVAQAIEIAREQCIRFGVTAVGDISKFCDVSRPLLSGGPLRVASFGEASGIGKLRPRYAGMLARAADQAFASPRLGIGISPHSPYTVDGAGYREAMELARTRAEPICTHLAESPHEAEFLSDHAGPFRELWDRIGSWEDWPERFAGGPIRFAQSIGLLDVPAVLAHVNYCDDDELAVLAAGKASVVYCPRTHAYFGHPPHRWRDMLAAGVNVAVGTDSCASSPDLNLVDDLRLMHRLSPDIPPRVLWEMATVGGARALGMEMERGTLAVGKAADAVTFPVRTNDPLRELLEVEALPSRLWINGRAV